MLDANWVRQNPDKLKQIILSGRGNAEKANVDKWLELDEWRKRLLHEIEVINQKRNELAGRGANSTAEEREAGAGLKEDLKKAEAELRDVENGWNEIAAWFPNVPVSETAMPEGKGEEDNPIDKAWVPGSGYVDTAKLGTAVPKVDYMPERSAHWDDALTEPKHHIDIGEELGIIDNKQSAKVSGSRFTYLTCDAVLLQYAIQQLMFAELLKRGFKPIIPPLLVKSEALFGTSHFPEGKDQVYKIAGDNVEDGNELFLVGSSEPTNFSYFRDRVYDADQMPQKVFAYTPCFRSEVGSWGRDVKGIKRVHQFDKLEMNVVCMPEQSQEIFAELLSVNEWLLQTLEIPYRLARKCTSDAGYLASAEQIDPEAWLPGQKEFMEVGTDTNTTDFQARRLNIRYVDADGKKQYAHTVNDTGVAMGRMLIAIIDNYQQSDGSIKVPTALVQYLNKEYIGKD
jgi:seryl-tRNA synthetase